VTCQRARAALLQAGVTFETIDIFRKPLSVEDIRRIAAEHPISELFSWRSPQAKARGITPGSRSDAELVELMAQEPRLIRRPLVQVGTELAIGPDVPRINELVAGSD
jgi:arsenate reductase-like glutaredoxin family protein